MEYILGLGSRRSHILEVIYRIHGEDGPIMLGHCVTKSEEDTGQRYIAKNDFLHYEYVPHNSAGLLAKKSPPKSGKCVTLRFRFVTGRSKEDERGY